MVSGDINWFHRSFLSNLSVGTTRDPCLAENTIANLLRDWIRSHGLTILCRRKEAAIRVDAHQHFWQYTEEEFGWIDDAMASIRRSFLPSDLKPLIDASGVDATVAVQARQSLEETAWLLDLARQNDWIAGVVGWVPLASPTVDRDLEQFAAESKLVGVRHVLQAEHESYMAREDFNAGIRLLREYALVYDLLVLEHQLPAAIGFVDRHPDQVFILDHLAKPLIAARAIESWSKQIRELARRPQVACKISGMVTEADFKRWTTEDLRPYFDVALEAFGPSRLLFGSDWPVCAVACEYSRWCDVVKQLAAELSAEEQAMIFGENAVRLYDTKQ
jgi:L-fuconolactonase